MKCEYVAHYTLCHSIVKRDIYSPIKMLLLFEGLMFESCTVLGTFDC